MPEPRHLAAVIDVTPALMTVLDPGGRFLWLNRAAEAAAGRPASELIGRPAWDVIPDDERERVRHVLTTITERGTNENDWLAADGTRRRIAWDNDLLRREDGTVECIVSSGIDVTERRATEAQVRDGDRRFAGAFDFAPIGMCIVRFSDETGLGEFVRVNDALCRIAGRSAGDLMSVVPGSLLADAEIAERERAEWRRVYAGEIDRTSTSAAVRRPDGEEVEVEVHAALVRDDRGAPRYVLAHVVEVGEKERYERRLRDLAVRDVLTGLYTRQRFERFVAEVAAAAAEPGQRAAELILIDVDRVAALNEAYGTAVGDEALAQVGRTLEATIRAGDVAGRIGGDCFGVLTGAAPPDAPTANADRLLQAIRTTAPIVGGRSLAVTASAGITCFDPDLALSPEELFGLARSAMRRAKDAGRDRAVVAGSPDGRSPANRRHWIERIRDALEADAFELHAQPIVVVATNQILRHELLLRLRDSEGTLSEPGAFLPVAERFGLMPAVDAWVVRQAAGLAEARHLSGEPAQVAVNLSAASMIDDGVLAEIESAVADPGVPSGALQFEITETEAIVNIEAASRFASRLAELGCGVAIDDFGSGYGAFYYLKNLAVDTIKIDGEFIAGLRTSEADLHTVRAIVELAHGLGMTAIAERVEDDETLAIVRELGVDAVQGALLGAPVPVAVRPA